MSIRPIRTDDDYRGALARASHYVDNEPEPGSVEGDEFEVLVALIDIYEQRRFPMAAPDPVEAIKFRMDQLGLEPKDLVPAIGQRNRVYEILNGKRELTLPMIRKLHVQLGIPVESLIGPEVDQPRPAQRA